MKALVNKFGTRIFVKIGSVLFRVIDRTKTTIISNKRHDPKYWMKDRHNFRYKGVTRLDQEEIDSMKSIEISDEYAVFN